MDSVLSLEVDGRGFVSEADRDEFFRQQFRLPENTTCFDCGFSNPKWTSVSFSIYLCLNCSGRHRQLGSHISFVRSVDMDRFTRDQLARLSLGGNGRFSSFLSPQDLLKRPLNYTNDRVLAYTARLDAELAKHVPRNSPKPDSEQREEHSPASVNRGLNAGPDSDPAAVTAGLSLDSPRRTDTMQSSLLDDAEKMPALKSDAFGDLLDLRSISSDDLKVGAPEPDPPLKEVAPETAAVGASTDAFDVFEKLEEAPAQGSSFKFDSFSEFVAEPVEKLEKTRTNDSVFDLDFAKPSAAPGSFGSFGVAGQLPKEPGFREGRFPKSKFSSKANDFDFDSFEKQNKLQSSLAASAAAPAASAAFSASAFGTASGFSSLGAFGTATFGPSANSATSAPGSSFKAAASPSRTVAPVAPPFPAQSASLSAGSSFEGHRSPVAKEGLARAPPHKPDLSQFEGKKAISSDAFFGHAAPQPAVASQVSPNRLAFSSDDYFGRPRQEVHHLSTIEDQALQNLSEIKENIVSALNKGGVLLEKARNWLYTNYY